MAYTGYHLPVLAPINSTVERAGSFLLWPEHPFLVADYTPRGLTFFDHKKPLFSTQNRNGYTTEWWPWRFIRTTGKSFSFHVVSRLDAGWEFSQEILVGCGVGMSLVQKSIGDKRWVLQQHFVLRISAGFSYPVQFLNSASWPLRLGMLSPVSNRWFLNVGYDRTLVAQGFTLFLGSELPIETHTQLFFGYASETRWMLTQQASLDACWSLKCSTELSTAFKSTLNFTNEQAWHFKQSFIAPSAKSWKFDVKFRNEVSNLWRLGQSFVSECSHFWKFLVSYEGRRVGQVWTLKTSTSNRFRIRLKARFQSQAGRAWNFFIAETLSKAATGCTLLQRHSLSTHTALLQGFVRNTGNGWSASLRFCEHPAGNSWLCNATMGLSFESTLSLGYIILSGQNYTYSFELCSPLAKIWNFSVQEKGVVAEQKFTFSIAQQIENSYIFVLCETQKTAISFSWSYSVGCEISYGATLRQPQQRNISLVWKLFHRERNDFGRNWVFPQNIETSHSFLLTQKNALPIAFSLALKIGFFSNNSNSYLLSLRADSFLINVSKNYKIRVAERLVPLVSRTWCMAFSTTALEVQRIDSDINLFVGNRAIRLRDFSLSQDWDGFFWVGRGELANATDVCYLAIGKECILRYGDIFWTLRISAFQVSRKGLETNITCDFESVTATIKDTLLSKNWRGVVSSESVAKEILSGFTVIWEAPEKKIVGEKLAAQKESQIEILKRVMGNGLMMQTLPAGEVCFRARYRKNADEWGSTTPDIIVSQNSELSWQETYQPTIRGSAILVSNELGTRKFDSAYIATSDNTGEIHILPNPFAGCEFLHLETSGHESIQILGKRNALQTQTLLVEFVNGIAQLPRPIFKIMDVQWKTRDLGSVSYDVGATTLYVVNGFSLAVITYIFQVVIFEIQHNIKNPETQQFIIKEIS